MSTTKLAQLKRAAKRRGITQEQIAAAAAVTRYMVCHVLAGRYKSRRVVAVAQRLIAQHDEAMTSGVPAQYGGA